MTRLLALAILFTLSAGLSMAQSVPSWSAPLEPAASPAAPDAASMAPPEPGPTPTQVPIDGGLGLLALAGGAYAARRLRASR